MSFFHSESDLKFEFPADWVVVRYDDGAMHSSLNKALSAKGTGVKGVDFIALTAEGDVLLLEIKNFRGYRIENKIRLTQSKLAEEISWKVFDTLGGVISELHARGHTSELGKAGRAVSKKCRLFVVAWIEGDDEPNGGSGWVVEMESQRTQLDKKISPWLHAAHVVVVDTERARKFPVLRAIEVERLPRRRID